MAIPEAQLETWSHQGAAVGSRETYASVKGALEARDTKYASAGHAFEVFLQGSYGNDTNIWAESDVDVVIRLDATYFHDTAALTPQELAAFQMGFAPATYFYTNYKNDVVAALEKKFGTDVKPGNRAVTIRANGARRSADVVVAAEFRRYYSASPLAIFAGLTGSTPLAAPQYERGICFFTPTGQIINYPKQHSANCTAKHQATNSWFKPMVRILKNMRSKLVEDGAIAQGSAPSYFIEGLLFNVPDNYFGTSYGATFIAAINWLFQANRMSFRCANKQQDLIRDAVATCWACSDSDGFLNAIAKLWNEWR